MSSNGSSTTPANNAKANNAKANNAKANNGKSLLSSITGMFGYNNSNSKPQPITAIQTITSAEAEQELKRQENMLPDASTKGGRRRSNTKKSRKVRKTRKARKCSKSRR